MATVNVAVGLSFTPPIVTLLAPDGRRAGNWEWVQDLAEVGIVMDSLLTARDVGDVTAH